MNYDAGVCPKCKQYLLLKNNVPFLVCPLCGESISNQEATNILKSKCHNADMLSTLIADCAVLEVKYGPELPFLILSEICEHFPLLESPAYLLIKMTGYDLASVRYYLKNFAGTKSDPMNVPWAEDFLDNCLTYRNMEFADLFVAYINNKIRPEKKDEYLKKVEDLRKEYTFKASDPNSTKWLMALYIGASVLNVLLFPVFMLISGWLSWMPMYYAVNIGIAMLVVCVEVLLLYLHHHIYGNRLGMSNTERLLMVIFMSSMVFVVGTSFIGSIWKIKL